jgi:hypothetical protein
VSAVKINKLLLVDDVRDVGKTRHKSFFVGDPFADKNSRDIFCSIGERIANPQTVAPFKKPEDARSNPK